MELIAPKDRFSAPCALVRSWMQQLSLAELRLTLLFVAREQETPLGFREADRASFGRLCGLSQRSTYPALRRLLALGLVIEEMREGHLCWRLNLDWKPEAASETAR